MIAPSAAIGGYQGPPVRRLISAEPSVSLCYPLWQIKNPVNPVNPVNRVQ